MKKRKEKQTTRLVSWLLAVAMLVSSIAIAPTTTAMAATADELREGTNYLIVSKKSGKAMTIEGNSAGNNAPLYQMPVGNYESQVWTLDYADGYYQIINKYSGKSLNVPFASVEAGTKIVQFNKENSDNSKWAITDVGDGYCRITPKMSPNFGLNVEGASNDRGAAIIQWNYNGADNERWEFREIAEADIRPNPKPEKADVEAALDAYIDMFIQDDGGISNIWGFWAKAETIEVLIDAYEHYGTEELKNTMVRATDWWISSEGQNWEWNSYNDDIMWAVSMCARVYKHTGDEKYKNIAKSNFDMCYGRAWTDELGGGLVWKEGNKTKNACVNGPGAIAACHLGDITGDNSYYDKAKAIMEWEKENMLMDNGGVKDSINWETGEESTWCSTYNQGTFIGACTMLYKHFGDQKYYDWAKAAADYASGMGDAPEGYLNREQNNGDLIGFKGILARWLGYFTRECDVDDYDEWMQANADAAWTNRNSDNIMWTQFGRIAPENVQNSNNSIEGGTTGGNSIKSLAAWGASAPLSWLVNCTGLEIVAEPDNNPADTDSTDTASNAVYEMENGALSGGAAIVNDAGNSNGKYVGNVGGPNGGTVTYHVTGVNGKAKMVVSYATWQARQLDIIVNGRSNVVNCAGTGSWTAVGEPIEVEVDLNAGDNTIQFTGVNGAYAPNLDKFEVEFLTDTYSFEIEAGTLAGGAQTVNAAAVSGDQYVGNVGGGNNGSSTVYVASAMAGKSKLRVYYATRTARQLSVIVNGVAQTVDCAGTGGWGTVGAPVEIEVDLKAGNNAIQFTGVNGAYAPNLDRFEIALAKSNKTMYTLEAENGTLSGSAAVVNAADCSNGKYVGNIGGPNAGMTTFNVTGNAAEKRVVRIYYATRTARQFNVVVNGNAQAVNCNGTGGWGTVGAPIEIEVDLQPGNNIIAITGVDGGYAPNLDRVEVELTAHEAAVK